MADKNDSFNPPTITIVCSICNNKLSRPHLLPCLHVFCLPCLQDECQGNSSDKFYCPLCVTADEKDRKSTQSRPWHSFERIMEKETEDEELQKRLAELPAFDDGESWNVDESDDSSGGSGSNPPASRRVSTILEQQSLFPCTMHVDRLADTYCFKCNQLACSKCVSSFHRRCQSFSELQTAVETKRSEFDQIHAKMAANLVACDEVKNHQTNRIKELEEMRTRVLIDIKSYRTELVNTVLAKEKSLTSRVNRLIDQMKQDATTKNEFVSRMSESLHKQMEFLDLSMSVRGEGEILPLFPGLATTIEKDAGVIRTQYSEDANVVTFTRDENCKEVVTKSTLGQVNVETTEDPEKNAINQNGVLRDLNLAQVTSFHGGTRDDVTEPLLTDLILLANGDVILTDRDNKCVKKFNQSGKLLTRVIIDAVPSRIASVSHARAVVSVMTKKYLYFLSLFGTVRILNSVPVKKIYSFLTSVGNGLLIAGTNQCDSIDLLSERGETLKKIFTQKPDRATIARPLYLTPVVPHSLISQKLEHRIDKEVINTGITPTTTIITAAPSVTTNAINNSTAKISSSNISSETNPVLPHIIKNGKRLRSQTPTSSSGPITSLSKGNNRRRSLQATKHVPPSFSSHISTMSSSTSTNSTSSTSSATNSSSSISSTSTSTKQPNSSHDSNTKTNTSTSDDIDLLVSDSGKRILFRMQQDGGVAFTLRSSDQVSLECPLGVTVHETGLTLLSDRDSDCVLLLDQTGRCMKKVLTYSDGVIKPCGIYAGQKGIVAITQVDGMVKIFKPV